MSERSLALWLRLEAGLLEADESAWARLDAAGRFLFSVALDPAPAAIAAASVRVSPMSRDKRAAPGGRDRGERTGRERPLGGPRAGDGERKERPKDARGKGGDRPPRRRREDGRAPGAGKDRPPRAQGAGQDRPARSQRAQGGFGERRPRKSSGRG